MDFRLEKNIVAVVTTRTAEQVAHGVPVFYVPDDGEQEQVSFLLGRLLDAIPHDLGNGTFVLIQH